MNIIIFFLLITILITCIGNVENFDGIGKGYGQFYFPKKCCKSMSCYPGMYLGNDFWILNR